MPRYILIADDATLALGFLRRTGWQVHVVGQAAFAHGPNGYRLVIGCFGQGRPAWADRLTERATAGPAYWRARLAGS
ncbi:MAG TPA: hypothetical protein VFW86_03925 [Candidatus Limnocylindrales bacterium]|nr:hypothetical protein [Candidatus Limnocylindrales bacterium]